MDTNLPARPPSTALVTASATRGGKSFQGRVVHVFHMRDGKMTEFWSFPENQSLLDEFWA